MLSTIYKCRLCGKIFACGNYHIQDNPHDLLVRNTELRYNMAIHECEPPTKAGLADFIGMETTK